MKNTKEKILECALDCFNENGFYNTTLRQIASSLGISQGNLNYHFRTKGEILEILYFDLVERMEIEIKKMGNPQSMMQVLFESSKISLSCLYAYRFLMRDLYKIMKEHTNIQGHYNQLPTTRLTQFTQIFDNLINQGVLRVEEFENEYRRLFVRMNILGDNWINTQELINKEIKNPIEYYQLLLFEVIYPYLTSQGKLDFNKIIEKDSK